MPETSTIAPPNAMPGPAPSPGVVEDISAIRDEIHLTRINDWVRGLVDDGIWPQGKSGIVIITIHNGAVPSIGAIKKQKVERLLG